MLHQLVPELDGNGPRPADDLRRLGGAPLGARQDTGGLETLPNQAIVQPPGLFPPRFGQVRLLAALHPSLYVAHRLGVSDQQEPHAGAISPDSLDSSKETKSYPRRRSSSLPPW